VILKNNVVESWEHPNTESSICGLKRNGDCVSDPRSAIALESSSSLKSHELMLAVDHGVVKV
jgi:hypothetical protein